MTAHRPHKAMKDSGVAWLGEIPAHWDVRRLGQFFFERREKVSDKDFPPLSVTKNGVVPQLETAAKTDDGDNRKKVCVGDFVINSRSDRKGSSGVSPHDGSVSLINTVLQPSGGLRINFVNHLLRSLPFQEEFYRVGNGIVADMWTTKYSEMKTIQVPVPDEIEQQAIATHLDRETARIDALIAKKTRFIELLAEKRQALITRAVTNGLNPNAKMKDSGVEWLGEVPAHWSVSPIKYVGRIGNGSTPSRENPNYWSEMGFPWLNSSVVNQEEVSEAAQFVTSLALQECHLPIVEPPAVLVGITGQGKTRGMSAPLTFRATINQHLAFIQPESRKISVEFLLRCLQMAYPHLRFASEGAGSTKGAITCEQLGNFPIPLPSLQEQREIVDFLEFKSSRIGALISKTERSIELLHEHRTALITAAVTGKIDLRDTA